MENENDSNASDRGTDIEYQFEGRCYPSSTTNQCPVIFDVENDDDVVYIGSSARIASNSSISSDRKPSFSPKNNIVADDYDIGVDAESDEIEWIISTKVDRIPRHIANRASKPNVFNVEDEIDNCDCNVIDVEQEFSSESDRNCNLKQTRFVDRYGKEDDIETAHLDSSSSPPEESCTLIVNAMVHADASPSPSLVVMRDESVQNSEIDEYDARMRTYFGLDGCIGSVETKIKADELNANTSEVSINKEEMHRDYGNKEAIFLNEEDPEEDDCVITGVEHERDRFADVFCIDSKNRDETKTKIIVETVDEIFRRMMPLAVPGVLSLFSPDRNCLPRNVRPLKFCYYYFVSSHIVVKEIIKQEFFKFKEQIIQSKKSYTPPKCSCISHPLNQNASKLTLLTNPYSMYHKPNCHFARSSKNNKTRPKRPRRLTYQVSLHRIPQKREGKDFKEWSDIILRRRQKAAAPKGNFGSANWLCDVKEKPDSIQH